MNNAFERAFEDWERRAVSLNQKLMPFVNANIDITTDDWLEKLTRRPHPADMSGLRLPIETLFGEIVKQFEFYNSEQRQQIIDLMYQNDALMYAASIVADRNTSGGFRKYMILFVIADQGKDTRDAMLALESYHVDAEVLGFDVSAIFKEMTEIASRQDKFGWGSTRDLFLKYIK
ncbi:MAG: hypothetical protein L3J65_12180 [Robiginitomaculum sp.]|nr:hypothetical protein [Robiginitomaculum sp.]